ncbi:MAG: SH3 domain-containing protein [Deltaproteobacteria bacterium]|nr:SH3 domain-containing protein [Candidatus Anaeroferrophillacea bacterium]
MIGRPAGGKRLPRGGFRAGPRAAARLFVTGRFWPRLPAAVLLFCFASLLPVFLSAAAPEAPPTRAVAKVSRLNVRQAPDRRAPLVFKLERGQGATVTGEDRDWLEIRTKSGSHGWVYRPLVKLVHPEKTVPEVHLETHQLDDPEIERLEVAAGFLPEMLAAWEPETLRLVASRLPEAPQKLLLVLEIPFSPERYEAERGNDVEPGVIDLLPYRRYLKALLTCRLRLGDAAGTADCYLMLRKANGDQVMLSGSFAGPVPVFGEVLVVGLHGYELFQIATPLPVIARDFNRFTLPEPLTPDGRRTVVAGVYDFFGFEF